MNKKTIAAGAAAAALAGTIAMGTTASASPCPSGQVKVAGSCGVVTGTSPDEYKGRHVQSGPARGTGGLIFRSENGFDLGSGMGEEDQFIWEGKKHTTADGTKLIYVKQTTRGVGGWGPLYEGWVRQEFTMAPELFR